MKKISLYTNNSAKGGFQEPFAVEVDVAVFADIEFEKNNSYFKNKEDCQKYCDKLNSKP
jgi:hypothetical protein